MSFGSKQTMGLQSADVNRAGFRSMLVGSMVVHLVAVLAFFVFTDHQASSRKRAETLMVTKLVRLGKKRPEHLLPRLHKAAPPPPAKVAPPKIKPVVKAKPRPKPVPKVAPKPVPKAPPKAAPKRPQKPASPPASHSLSSVFDRLRAAGTDTEEPEGDPEGDAQGEVSEAGLAVIGSVYATKLDQSIRKCYFIEGIDPARIAGRATVVWVRVNQAGLIVDFRIEKPSGVQAMDRSVLKAIQACSQGPRPPKELRRRVYNDGIEFEFK